MLGNVPKGTSSNAFTGKNLTHNVIQLCNFYLDSIRKGCSNIMMSSLLLLFIMIMTEDDGYYIYGIRESPIISFSNSANLFSG